MNHLWLNLNQQLPQNSVDIFSLILNAGLVVKIVIIILLLMSIISWGIIVSKILKIKSVTKKSNEFVKKCQELNKYYISGNFRVIYQSTKKIDGPLPEIFMAGCKEIVKIKKMRDDSPSLENFSSKYKMVEFVEIAVNKAMTNEISKLDSSLTFLATTGNTAPFIGLFGTVWGIMTSFIGLVGSEGVPSLQVVAPGIAEALIATAIGLGAAIPAVIGYNHFVGKIRKIDLEMENFSAEFLNIVERNSSKLLLN